MAFCWPFYTSWTPEDMRLGPSLVRQWPEGSVAMERARLGLEEARASGCPVRVREWREAVRYIERSFPVARKHKFRALTLRDLLDAMGVVA